MSKFRVKREKPEGSAYSGTGIYIHFPFCRRRCPYCSFCSFTDTSLKPLYHELLLIEAERASEYFVDLFPPVDTIYFGGGTPSLIPVFAVDEILTRIRCLFPLGIEWNELEITMEANPEDMEVDYLRALRSVGINRLSIGAQRFDDSTLKLLGREHRIKDTIDGFVNAREAGFRNISLDFIAGIQNDNVEPVRNELKIVSQYKPEHVSAYLLEIKEGTAFSRIDSEKFPDDDITAEIYLKMIDILSEYGFEQYEISNFAKKGFRSRHNLKYWSGLPWFGLGCSSASYSVNARWVNPNTVEDYRDYVTTEDYRIPPPNAEEDRKRLADEEFFMAMRKTEGLDLKKFVERWGFNPTEGRESLIETYIEEKLLIRDSDTIKLTHRGFLISNELLSNFIS
jgi:oxygen-independent coproporphyrinogen-3 oxidase